MGRYEMQLVAVGDRELRATRKFDAPRELVFDALTQADRLKQWFGGPVGWTLAVCEYDPQVGGSYRYVWQHADGSSMGMGGRILEFVPPERVITTEKFDKSWYPGEAIGTIELTEQTGVTTLTLTVRYETKDARDQVMLSPMGEGMALGYDSLELFLSRSIALQ